MKPTLENLVYFGIGSALLAKEKLEKGSATVRESLEASEQKAREFFEQAIAKGGSERDLLKNNLREVLQEVIAELGLVTKADLEEALTKQSTLNK